MSTDDGPALNESQGLSEPAFVPAARAVRQMPPPMAIESLRTSGESAMRILCLVVAVLLYLLCLLSCFGLVYLGIFMAAAWISLAFMINRIKGNGIKVGPEQLPHIHASVCRVSNLLQLREPPEVYVIQEHGLINAFATRFAMRRYVVVYSDLVEACGDDSVELDMILAHEIGHLALGHITWLWVLFPAMFIPLLSQGYMRACEYSADRCGHAGCGDPGAAVRGLLILAAGGNCGRMASIEAALRQRHEVDGFWQTVIEWWSTHPWVVRRVAALST